MKVLLAAFDSVPIGICVIDSRHVIRFWNATLELWSGIRRDEILGTPLGRYNPEFGTPYYRDRLDEVFSNGSPVYFSSRLHGALFPTALVNGRRRSVNISVTLLELEGDDERYALFSLLDVTDLETGLEKLRKEKLKYARELEQSKRLQEELEQKKRLAEQAVTVKSRFLANMSHEIRTPMSGILGFISLLDATELDETQRLYIEMLKTSGELLKSLVNDVLDLSKLEAEKRTLKIRPTEIRRIADSVRNLFLPASQGKRLSLIVTVDDSVPAAIMTDQDAITQIAMNLVSNAVKFTDKGFVRAEFSYSAEPAPGRLVLHVQDTGIGIPNDRIDEIFDYFTQLDDSLTKRAMGTGLGLAIVKGLVELLEGQIRVRSVPGHGTIFMLEVPVRAIEVLHDEPQEEQDDADLRAPGTSVLVIDDNDINLLYLQAVLAKYGYFVVACKSVKEALGLLCEHRFDAALVDLQMPDESGFDFAAEVRGGKTCADENLPLIAVTGFAYHEMRERCMEEGFRDFITKPISERTLAQKLHSILRSAGVLK